MDKDGRLTQIGDAIATGHVPMSLIVMNGLIFVGTGRLTTTNEARVYRINPLDETTWTLDHTFDADDYLITALESFEGRLYATTKNGGGATKGKVVQRGTDGVWVTVDSTVNNTGSYEGLAVFNNQLYASSRNYDAGTSTAVIRRTSDGSTWATVYNATATTGVGLLNVLGLRIFSQGGTGILHSLNGTSYTAATPAGGGNCDGALGVLVQSGAAIWQVPVATPSTQVIPSIVNISQGLSSFDTLDDRKRHVFFCQAGTTMQQIGFGTLGETGSTSAGDSDTDSRYKEYRSAGTVNSNMGVLCSTNRSTRVGFEPRFKARIRTWGTNQAEYFWWVGLFNQTSASDTDTLTAEGIAFRYHHPVGSGADSGNWFLCIHDGASQVDTDTAMPVLGGATAGINVYRMTLEVTSPTSVTWTIENLTAGTSGTGTVAISGAFDATVPLGGGCWGTDVNGAVKVIALSGMYLDTD
jgi:hypothetical protein